MAYDNNVYKNKTEDYKIAPSKVIRKIFACGNRNPSLWTGIQYLVSGIHSVESKIFKSPS